MAIVEMKKMTLIALTAEQERIVDLLQQLGVVEVINLMPLGQGSEATEAVNELNAKLADLQFALDFIKRHGQPPKKKGKRRLTQSAYNELVAQEPAALAAVATARRLEAELGELRSEESRLKGLSRDLAPWAKVNVPLEALGEAQETVMALGSLPTDRLNTVKSALASQFPDSYLAVIEQGKEESRLFIAYHRSYGEACASLLRGNGWSPVNFKGLTGTPAAALEQIENDLAALEPKQAALKAEAANLTPEQERLEVLYDHLSLERERHRIAQYFVKTEQTFMLEGWLPARYEAELRQQLDQLTGDYQLVIREPAEGEVAPTLLENNAFAAPYEAITEMYSLPESGSIDPTPFVAPFFFAFFGFMVSDAGYGLVMAIIATLALRLLKPQGSAKKLIGILAVGGVSTMIWGLLFGGWFGIPVLPPLLFSPLDDPIGSLFLCFGLGAVHLLLGLGLKAYANIRAGKPLDALFDQGFWVLLLTGLPLLALPNLATVGKVLSIGGAAGLILTQGRNEKGFVKKLFSGITSLFDITGYLGDILSYARLFALGIATAVVAEVINTLATMMGGSVLGTITQVIVLIAAHGFNMVINIMGAFIHSARLQFIEFFGKFFEGGGKSFAPFHKKTKYIDVLR